MKAFTFVRPTTLEEASKAAAVKGSVVKAGGIDLLDRMKERVDEPERVVWLGDVASTTYREIELGGTAISIPGAMLRIGGGVTLAEIAASDVVRKHAPAVANAAASAASPQIRARATLAGNLCQHTRCGYYRHASFPCFKRGDEKCPVLADGAVQEFAAIFGNRECASAHPSSLAPALAACRARVHLERGAKSTEDVFVPIEDFYVPPRRGIASDVALEPGAVVVCVTLPVGPHVHSTYEEIRQKAAFDWALVSCAIRFGEYRRGEGGLPYQPSIWLGGVAPTPWRAVAAEKAYDNMRSSAEIATIAAEGATPLSGNAYKLDLVKVVVRRALERLRAGK